MRSWPALANWPPDLGSPAGKGDVPVRLAGKPARPTEGHARRRRADLRHRCLRTRAGLLVVLWTVAGVACNRHEDGAAQVNPPVRSELQPTSTDDTRSFGTIAEELFGDRAARELEYWRTKPLAPDLLAFSLQPRATDADREAAARMKAGEFRPSGLFDWQPIGVPPPWDENPLGNNSWDFYRHALRWIEPLVTVWFDDGDAESLTLAREIVRDWRNKNGQRPGASPYAWFDHSVVYRLRVFCWLWELGRTREAVDEGFAIELVELIHSHAELLASGELYAPRSNHGLEQNSALLGAAILFPEFRGAERWREMAYQRVEAYVADNFSPEGFHLEQSPGYHWYVLSRLAPLTRYLRVNQQPPMPALEETAHRAASVWPYLVRPNGHVANVGDTHDQPARGIHECWKKWRGDAPPPVARSTLPDPRQTPGEFLLSFDAGYAIFTAYPIDAKEPEPDTYVLYKCNAFPYTHHHTDALSFMLYGLGSDWLVDAGAYSYDQDAPQRKYVRSPRAHNLVLIDGEDSKLGRVELVDFGRTEHGDFVSARHHLPQATHTRTLTFVPPYTIEISDELVSADARPHTYSQLFHLAPALEPRIISDRCVQVVAEDGKTCVIEQSGAAGEWEIVIGQKEPYWQGWYSPGFRQIEPVPTLYYTCVGKRESCVLLTEIRLGGHGLKSTGTSTNRGYLGATQRPGCSRNDNRN
jgi:hypothetical protein